MVALLQVLGASATEGWIFIAPISAVVVSVTFVGGPYASPIGTSELIFPTALHKMGSTDDHHEGKDEADVDDGRRNPHLDGCLKLHSFFKQFLTDALTKSTKSQGLISALPPASYLCSN